MITEELADRIDWLTSLSVRAFDRMVEIELLLGRDSHSYETVKAIYERNLERLGQAMTDAVGFPGQERKGKRYA